MATLTMPGVFRPPLALVVDGDTDTRHMYAEFLRLSACEVDEADDGREALAKALSRHPDVIVTDTRLPGISGLDLCRLLRQDREMHDTPILFVTGDVYEPDVRCAQAAGADAVLVKPCLPEQLAQAIKGVWQRPRESSARLEPTVDKAQQQKARCDAQVERPQGDHRIVLSHTHERAETVHPPLAPPTVVCPKCDRPLRYMKSHLGGVSARYAEQWDYFQCTGGCGTFQYRHRTRRLRLVS